MEADSMRVLLKNNRINTMFLKTKSFVISLDTLKNFNQIKGRTITAYFITQTIKPDTLLDESMVSTKMPISTSAVTVNQQKRTNQLQRIPRLKAY